MKPTHYAALPAMTVCHCSIMMLPLVSVVPVMATFSSVLMSLLPLPPFLDTSSVNSVCQPVLSQFSFSAGSGREPLGICGVNCFMDQIYSLSANQPCQTLK